MSKTVSWHIQNQIGYITLSAPPKNEMHPGFFADFTAIVEQIKSGTELKGIIITSKGRHFSSGANIQSLLAEFKGAENTPPKFVTENNNTFDILQNLSVPVIACLKGICFGSALELALCAHFRIAAPNSLLSLPETGFGIIPGLSGIFNTQKILSTKDIFSFILKNEVYNAEIAKKKGLIDLIEEKSDVLSTAVKLIEQLPANYNKLLKQNYLRTYTKTLCS